MQVRVSISWKIVVDGEIDFLDIDTSAKDIRRNTDTFVEILELFVALDTVIELVTITKRQKG